jgi:hypothetical protein
MGREKLEGNESVELEVLGLVDHTHPALAELREDLIVRYSLTDHPVPPERSVHGMKSFS